MACIGLGAYAILKGLKTGYLPLPRGISMPRYEGGAAFWIVMMLYGIWVGVGAILILDAIAS